MAVNKVIYAGQTLIDLTSSTVTADKLANGATAFDASGKKITGTGKSISTWGDLFNGGYIWNDLTGGGSE